MGLFDHKRDDEELKLLREELEQLRSENRILKIELRLHQQELMVLRDIDQKITPQPPPTKILSYIKIAFTKGAVMAEGPVTLSQGQSSIASIDGFDQNGAPWTGAIPTPNWTIDNPSLDTIAPDTTNPANESVTYAAAGTANLSVSLTTAEGKALTDTETVTNVAAAPVLSSIKINFSTPTP